MQYFYDLNQTGISYLFDANDEFLQTLKEKTTTENVQLEEVKQLEEKDKQMMAKVRRF